MTKIPIVIGRRSSGEEYEVELQALPNIFISYSHDSQLPDMLVYLVNELLKPGADILIALSLSSPLAKMIKPGVPHKNLFLEFLHADGEADGIASMEGFIRAIIQEVQYRSKCGKPTSGRHPIHTPLVVVIDNLFEVIMSSKKRMVRSFIKLLTTAALQQVYFIMGVSGIYRSLLAQLATVGNTVQGPVSAHISASQPLGAELVINPDDLLFYRNRNEIDHIRLYKV